MEGELSANMSRIAAFAFPEYDDAVSQRIPRDKALNRFSQYAMQPKSFQNYTFSMQLQSGVRIHGFVRRYLPVHPVVKHRYDVGRRGERALVILTRYSGGDLVYAAILKYVGVVFCFGGYSFLANERVSLQGSSSVYSLLTFFLFLVAKL